ncbi:MAG: zinc-dependent alcohol dehydrogenase family protein [Alphaproteobacteria bacterium]
MVERQTPPLGAYDVELRVKACGVCRTDLHVVDGDLEEKQPHIVPGHEVVGIVERRGAHAKLAIGDRVGVPWLAHTCGECVYCRAGRENLCDAALFTGWSRDGGYAEMMVADSRYCLPIPAQLSDADAAPLLCAGLIGYRCWRACGSPADVKTIGLYGFGAAAHILTQVANAHGQQVYAFTRPGDYDAQKFALSMGCVWTGGSDMPAPVKLDAAIIFAPVGALVPAALAAVRKGATVVCGGIHMSPIPSFPYQLLWEERRLVSIANLTRSDGVEFLSMAERLGVRTHPRLYALAQANEALDDLRAGAFTGAAVLTMSESA